MVLKLISFRLFVSRGFGIWSLDMWIAEIDALVLDTIES